MPYLTFKEFRQRVHEDWVTHGRDWTRPGFRALAVHRLGNWYPGLRLRPWRAIVARVYRFLYRYVRNHYGIELPQWTRVGRRLRIGHQSGIVIHYGSEIGDDCTIRQNVTLGSVTLERIADAPKLGNGVEIGCGAVILGKVTIGDGAKIGPNVVVLTNIPAGAAVFVAPPRIIALRQDPPEGAFQDGIERSYKCVSIIQVSCMSNLPEEILQVIYRVVDTVNADILSGPQLDKSPATPLMGARSVLDSLQLVGLVVGVEQELESAFGVPITLADERAMSQSRSPFLTIATLADYSHSLVREALSPGEESPATALANSSSPNAR